MDLSLSRLVGTLSSYFKIGSATSGIRLKIASSVLQIRNYGDSADASLKAAAIQLSTSPGANKYLGSDASGNGTWNSIANADLPFITWNHLAAGSVEPTVLLVETSNISISAPGATHDSVTMSSGYSMLLTGQTSTSENGPWIYNGAASPLTRPTWWPSGGSAMTMYGTMFFVALGTVYKYTRWMYDGGNNIVIDSGSQSFTLQPTSVKSAYGVIPIANLPVITADLLADFYKNPAWVATDTQTTISNPGTAVFDGVTLSNGLIVLLTGQSSPSQNGPWVFNGSGVAMTRPTWWASGSTFVYGSVIYVISGTESAGQKFTIWSCYTTGVVDTDAETWNLWAIAAKMIDDFHMKQVEIDFGSAKVHAKLFTITDTLVRSTSIISAFQAYEAATGKTADENEFDCLVLVAGRVANGSFKVVAHSIKGPVRGKFKINYVINGG